MDREAGKHRVRQQQKMIRQEFPKPAPPTRQLQLEEMRASSVHCRYIVNRFPWCCLRTSRSESLAENKGSGECQTPAGSTASQQFCQKISFKASWMLNGSPGPIPGAPL